MSELLAHIYNSIDESCRVKQELRTACAEEIITAARWMAGTIKKGGRILACGNGGSAADSQHLAAELVGRFKTDRKPLPAIALTTDTSIITSIANDYGYDQIFARQVEAHGTKKDLLIIYTTSGNSQNVIEAAKTAKKIGMKTIGITGSGGGKLKRHADLLIAVLATSTPRIQEAHTTISHILCELVERLLNLTLKD